MTSRQLNVGAIKNACKDWIAPFEVAKLIFGVFDKKQLRSVERQLNAARSLGLLKYHKGNNTYRTMPTHTLNGGA